MVGRRYPVLDTHARFAPPRFVNVETGGLRRLAGIGEFAGSLSCANDHGFRTAQVKKLVNLSHGKFYRARLGDADRPLFSLVRRGDEAHQARAKPCPRMPHSR